MLPAFVAEMDFPLAPVVRAALQSAIDNDDCGYADDAELTSAFTDFAKQRFDWTVDSARVFAVPDVMAGMAEALRMTTERGDGVVINPPVYPPFFEVINTVERRVVGVPLLHDADNGTLALDFAGLEKAFAAGARAYFLCSPHNPVGRVWSRADLERIADLVMRYDVTVISDEIHGPLSMPGVDFVPFLTVSKGLGANVAVTSASKAWNIAGLKCGVLIAGTDELAERLHARFKAMPTEIITRVGHLGVFASVAAFREGGQWLDELRSHLARNAALLKQLLADQIPAARYAPPDATYLAWIDFTALHLGADPARHFLKKGNVALFRGLDFGAQGANFARLNFATSSEILREIVRRMAASLG
ncbi:MAG: MalY/PatB family protein [Candidatus Eremiobacter antarcticus]